MIATTLEFLERHGFPQKIIVLIFGLAVGGTLGGMAMKFFYERQIAAAEREVTLQATVARSSTQSFERCVTDVEHFQALLRPSPNWPNLGEEIAHLRRENGRLDKLANNYNDWYQMMVGERDWYKNRDAVAERLKELESSRADAADAVVRWTTGSCSNADLSRCDLSPIGQRKLLALEKDRDQLHAQVLDLQARVTCSK